MKTVRVSEVLRKLEKTYPNAHCELKHRNTFQLLIATILSAQCTDVRVNLVTPGLFRQFPNPKSFSQAPLEKIEEAIRSTGFYRAKAKNIQACCRILVEKYRGKVPQTMEDLRTLPGVGRKTANVVLGNAFGMEEGIVVDTHVSRLSQRLGLTRQKTPEKIELDLIKKVPRPLWIQFSHWLIWHGRRRCYARKPDCLHCELASLCPSFLRC
ncbi:MAG: endonuclease III [Verrucomicrobiia bacterium]